MLSPGYCHYLHTQHNRGNHQSHCDQELCKLRKVVLIPHIYRHQEKINGRNPTSRLDNPGAVI